MRAIVALALKDIKLLLRDKFGLFWLLAFPLLMALFFGSIFSSGSSNRASMKVVIVDRANSDASGAFTAKLDSSASLTIVRASVDSAKQMVRQGKAVAYLQIEPGFGDMENLFNGDTNTSLIVGMDPSRSAEAGYLQGLIMQAWFAQIQHVFSSPSAGQKQVQKILGNIQTDTSINQEGKNALTSMLSGIGGFLEQIDTGALSSQSSGSSSDSESSGGFMKGPRIKTESVLRTETGPRSAWEITFPQALLWALIGCTAAFAIGIVVERTSGTMLRLRQAPISRGQILAGKGLACFIAAVTVCCLLLAIGKFIFSVRTPDPIMLGLAIVCTAICFVGLMMLMSVMGKTEQAVGGAGWAILLVFSMTGGGMVPLMAMPSWMLTISNISPVKWGIYALEGAIWRGFTLQEMALPLSILLVVGLVSFSTGVAIFKTTDK